MNNGSLNGLLLIDKPVGITSHDVVSRLRRVLKTREIGHSGTLDPLASGLMVCLMNEGTKLSQFVTEKNKEYRLTLKLGQRSDTYDNTGEVVDVLTPVPDLNKVLEVAEGLQGRLLLKIPIFSAAKIQGKRLYEYARAGIEIETPEKEMNFWGLKIEDTSQFPELTFVLSCSKGSFIRAWIHQLGEMLGCGAIMTQLRRTKTALFSIEQALKLDDIQGQQDILSSRGAFIPLSEALSEIKSIPVLGRDLLLIRNGQISYDLKSKLISVFNPEKDHYIQVVHKKTGSLLAVIALDSLKGFFIKRAFH